MPSVRRRLSPDRFGLNGESYVHGVMDGELLQDKIKQMEMSNQVVHERELAIEDEDVLRLDMEDIILVGSFDNRQFVRAYEIMAGSISGEKR